MPGATALQCNFHSTSSTKDGMATIDHLHHSSTGAFSCHSIFHIIIIIQIIVMKGFINSTIPFLMNEENRFEFVIPTVKCNG